MRKPTHTTHTPHEANTVPTNKTPGTKLLGAKLAPYIHTRGPWASCKLTGDPLEQGELCYHCYTSRNVRPRYIKRKAYENAGIDINKLRNEVATDPSNVEGYRCVWGGYFLIEFRCNVSDELKVAVLIPNNDKSPKWHLIKNNGKVVGIATPPVGGIRWHDRLNFVCQCVKSATVIMHIYDADGNEIPNDGFIEHIGGCKYNKKAKRWFDDNGFVSFELANDDGEEHPTEEDKQRLLMAVNDVLAKYRGYDNWTGHKREGFKRQ